MYSQNRVSSSLATQSSRQIHVPYRSRTAFLSHRSRDISRRASWTDAILPAGFFNFSPFQNYSHKHSSGSITQLFKLPHGTILASISEKKRKIDKNLPLIEVVTASHKNSGRRPERCQFALSKVNTARCDRNTFVHTSRNNHQHLSVHAHNRKLHHSYLVVSIFPFSTNGVRMKRGEETSHS